MEMRSFGRLGEVSAISLGGAAIAGGWGRPIDRENAVAIVREAVESGIAFIDVAQSYGNGEAELAVGEAFGGRLPQGVRVETKCSLGNPPTGEVLRILEERLDESLRRMKLERVDIYLLHGHLVPDGIEELQSRTSRSLFAEAVRPAFERLVEKGKIGDWGISGLALPSAVIETLKEDPKPAAVQVIANLLDSPGETYEEPARPREIIATAQQRGVGVMGVRALGRAALTDVLDKVVPEDHPIMQDYKRTAPVRALARELGESAASLACRYVLSMEGISTVVVGVKNREELREAIEAEAKGPLDSELIAKIDAAVGRV